MEKEKIRYVVVIQCENAKKRCSGFACSNSFYERKFSFEGYNANVQFLTMTCGGCCGSGVASMLEHLSHKLAKKTDIKKDEIAVHLSSCMVTENYHHDRCPNVNYIREVVIKKGYFNIVEGSYISMSAEKKRKEGVYKKYF